MTKLHPKVIAQQLIGQLGVVAAFFLANIGILPIKPAFAGLVTEGLVLLQGAAGYIQSPGKQPPADLIGTMLHEINSTLQLHTQQLATVVSPVGIPTEALQQQQIQLNKELASRVPNPSAPIGGTT